ncbi:MAG: transferrin-binding protein-like solute binding protein [Ostreibacterium sp.]
MKMNKILLMALSSFLIACGSGSSSGTTTSTPTTSTPTTSTPTTSTPTTSTPTTVFGNQIKVSFSGVVIGASVVNGTSDINQILLDGKIITLIPKGENTKNGFMKTSAGKSNASSGSISVVSGTKYSYARSGALGKVSTKTLTFFSQGIPTADIDMPTTGQVKYAGDYALVDRDKDYASGVVNFTADFANKTLAAKFSVHGPINSSDYKANLNPKGFGPLYSTEFGTLSYQANITGNKFTSKTIQGQFYGPKAVELGGTLTGNNIFGAFVAKKAP